MQTIWAVQELASFFQAKTANGKLASKQKTCTVIFNFNFVPKITALLLYQIPSGKIKMAVLQDIISRCKRVFIHCDSLS